MTPDGIIYDEKVEMVVVPGKEGELGILFAHTPLISVLKKGKVKIKKGKEEKILEINKGFIKVEKEQVEILIK